MEGDISFGDGLRLSDERVEALLVWDAVVTPECIDEARRTVRPEMFSNPHLRDAFAAVCARWDAGEPVDAAALVSAADSAAMAALTAWTGGGGVVATRNHASTLLRLWVARTARAFGERLIRLSSEPSEMPETALSEARAFADSLESCRAGSSEVSIAEAADRLADSLRRTRETREAGGLTVVPTGFPFLDERFLGGLRGGGLVILAARPGIGKTAVTLAMMMRQSALGVPAKIWSLEMGAAELAERVMYSLGGLRPGDSLTGRVDWTGAWGSARGSLEGRALYIEDGKHGVDDICADIAVSHQQGRCSAAYIDYLQLISAPRAYGETEDLRIAGITRRLKLLAKALDIPVVLCSQLNRVNVRDGREPSLHDLRGSGSIEQDADRVVFLSPREAADGSRLIRMSIGKNRQGGHDGDSVLLRPNETYSDFSEEVPETPAAAPPATAGGDMPSSLFGDGDGDGDGGRRHPDPYFDL